MNTIPFIGGAYEQRSPYINAQRSINCFPVIDNKESSTVIAMYGTPGLVPWVRIGGYGVPNDVDIVISEDTTLTEILRVDNLTINEGVTLDTAGFAIVVYDTLINNGSIVDTVSGGEGGEGGDGGVTNTTTVTLGESGVEGRAGLKYGAGYGGNGGKGGNSGGGASVYGSGHSYFYTDSPIYGGGGGYGGNGGRGGGRVIIYARTLTNNGTIDVSAEDGTNAGNGVAGDVMANVSDGGIPKYGSHIALVSSGSDGGKGGDGGDGGSVQLFYETLTEGTINVSGGKGGKGGTGGDGCAYLGDAGVGTWQYGYSWIGWPHTITKGVGADGTEHYNTISAYPRSNLYGLPGQGAGVKTFFSCTAYTSDLIKVSSKLSTDYEGFYAYTPKTNYVGSPIMRSWVSSSPTNQKIHIDIGTAKAVKAIGYHNFVDCYGYIQNSKNSSYLLASRGVKNFTLWGSNSPEAFATVTYGNHTGWTQLTTASSSFAQYSLTDPLGNLDLKEIAVTNETEYRYYALEFADNYGDASYMGLNHLALYGDEIDIHGADGEDGVLTKVQLVYPETDLDSTELRCMRVFNNNLYVVMGSGVFSIDPDGVITNYGTILTSTGYVDMAYNGVEILIVDGSAFGHYIAAGSLESVSPESDFPAATSCTFMDGYFIVTKADTGEICISGLYDVNSWDALDYATAEGAPDVATRVLSTNHNLWVFGEETTEIFYNSGNADFPFTRINGGLIEDGLGASQSVCLINSQFYWLNARREIVRNVGYQREKISTIHLDTELQGYSTVSDAYSWEYRLDGHIFYVITFPTADKTWVFDATTEYWHEWNSFKTEDSSTRGRHRGAMSAYLDGMWLVGDYNNTTIYELKMDEYTEDGELIPRTRRAQTIGISANLLTHDRIELVFETGTPPSTGVTMINPVVSLSWSDDAANTWSTVQDRYLGSIGDFANRVIWNRLGKSRSRIYELTMTEPVAFVLKGCIADIKGGSS